MLRTYEGWLRNDRIQWAGESPDIADHAQPMHVRVTVVDDPADSRDADRGRRMAAALEGLASSGVVAEADPCAWQREVRRERPLPGRGG